MRYSMVTLLMVVQLALGNEGQEPKAYLEMLNEHGAFTKKNDDAEIVAVNLSGSWIKDDDLKGIESLENLEELFLECTDITDASIQYLRQLTNLKRLNIQTTAISKDAVVELGFALKRCEINHSSIDLFKEAKVKYDYMLLSRALWKVVYDRGYFPSTDEGLEVLVNPLSQSPNWRGPYTHKDHLKDPFAKSANYFYTRERLGFSVISRGVDSRGNTPDDIKLTSLLQWNMISDKETVALLQMRYLAQACERYRADIRKYPNPKYGLASLTSQPEFLVGRWKGPYVDEPIANDPWGSTYQYIQLPIDEKRHTFRLQSGGSDGELNTDDDLYQLAIPSYMEKLHEVMENRDPRSCYMLGVDKGYLSQYKHLQALHELTVLLKAIEICRIVKGYSPDGFHDLEFIPNAKLAVKWKKDTSYGPVDPWGRVYQFYNDSKYDRVSLSSNGGDGQKGSNDDVLLTDQHGYLLTDSEISDVSKLKALGATAEYIEAAKRIQLNGDKATNPHSNIAWKRRSSKPTSATVKSTPSMGYPEALIARYDKNKDGVLDLEEIKGTSSLKPEYDSNKDGKLTSEEIAKAIPLDPRHVKYAVLIIARYDKNKDGVLDLEEIKGQKTAKPEYDFNKDGKLTPSEIAKGIGNK